MAWEALERGVVTHSGSGARPTWGRGLHLYFLREVSVKMFTESILRRRGETQDEARGERGQNAVLVETG